MSGPYPDRRELLATSAAFGASAFGENTVSAQPKVGDKPAARRR